MVDATRSAVSGAANPGAGPSASVEPPGTDNSPPGAAAPASAAPAAAAGFAAAWVRRDLPAGQWLAGVTPWCAPPFARSLATVDPANVAASRVTGRPRVLHAPVGRNAAYTVPTDAGTLTVTLTVSGGRWLVSSNDFTSSPR